MNPPTQPRFLQVQLPGELHRRVRDLAYDTGRSMGDLGVDAVLLLLRYHDRDDGLPLPLPVAIDLSDEERAVLALYANRRAPYEGPPIESDSFVAFRDRLLTHGLLEFRARRLTISRAGLEAAHRLGISRGANDAEHTTNTTEATLHHQGADDDQGR